MIETTYSQKTPIHPIPPQINRKESALAFLTANFVTLGIYGVWAVKAKQTYVEDLKHRYKLIPISTRDSDSPPSDRVLQQVAKVAFEVLATLSLWVCNVGTLGLFCLYQDYRLSQEIQRLAKDNPGNVTNKQPENELHQEPTTQLSPTLPDVGQKHPLLIGNTVANLMDRFTKAWNTTTQSFDLPSDSFNLENFTQHLVNHTRQFKKAEVTEDQHFGYIEKFDLDAHNPQIFVRADLHGDLKSLIENIRSIQTQGLLDENFKCQPGVHLVFLGDYCDRGDYGTEVLEMLMLLREENPEQVHLIRGNHENLDINISYGRSDKNLMSILSEEETANALNRFYDTLSLTTYFSVGGGERREYAHFTHGLFEPTMDPAPLLDRADSRAYLPVPKERKLSERIRKIADSDSELSKAAKRITDFVTRSQYLEKDMTAYNWADVEEDDSWGSSAGCLGTRQYNLCATDIRAYLDLSSEQHRVMMIFRGHQHKFQHLMHAEKVIVTTLPVGMNCPGYSERYTQPDLAYIIQPAVLVENWKKRAILRDKDHTVTDTITSPHPLTSAEV